MLKINGRIKYTKSLKRDIKSLKPLSGDEWDKPSGKVIRKHRNELGQIVRKKEAKSTIVKRIKVSIKEQLIALQRNQCGYCGNTLGTIADGQIEHFLPKKGKITLSGHPRYTFSPYNLVLACPKCNMVLKSVTDPIKVLHTLNYKNCEFYIVHPYLDNFRDHLEEAVQGGQIIISAKTYKGIRSIFLFELNNEGRCIQRAAKILYQKKVDSGEIDDELQEELIKRISSYTQGY
jgi:5-methylcytosine-specific restriction endonuclease McrA